jgi:hypothetical protein
MNKITHPDMSRGKTIPTQNQPERQNFVVEDMSSGVPEASTDIDQKLSEFETPAEPEQEAKQTIVTSPIPFTFPDKSEDELKKSLEKLIFMGRHNKELEIVGHKFEISTLTHKENNEIVKFLMRLGEAADLFTIRVLTLAYCLRSIDGMSLDDIDVSGQFESNFQKRMTIIDNMQLGMVERLYAAYEVLVKEADEIVYQEKIKN